MLTSGVTLPRRRNSFATAPVSEMPVREDQEVAVPVLGEHVQQARVQEGLPAQEAEEAGPEGAAFGDDAADGLRVQIRGCRSLLTQQPWHERLQRLVMLRKRNAGKHSPSRRRR